MREERISQKRLEELEQQLTERDRAILQSLQKCRYLKTDQITRLHFNNSTTKIAAIKAANRILSKLRGYGLIGALRRQVGGKRGGSTSLVWALRPAGFRLLCLQHSGDEAKKNFYEPSPYFLKHTLTTAETYLQIREICDRHQMEAKAAQIEPECWRYFLTHGGKTAVLKPDLFAVTVSGKYEDSWFIEVDLDTQSVHAVLEKCDRYIRYYQNGAEQAKNQIFPYVLWIVPDQRRKDKLKANIAAEFAHAPNIFVVITPNELEPLIVSGVKKHLEN